MGNRMQKVLVFISRNFSPRAPTATCIGYTASKREREREREAVYALRCSPSIFSTPRSTPVSVSPPTDPGGRERAPAYILSPPRLYLCVCMCVCGCVALESDHIPRESTARESPRFESTQLNPVGAAGSAFPVGICLSSAPWLLRVFGRSSMLLSLFWHVVCALTAYNTLTSVMCEMHSTIAATILLQNLIVFEIMHFWSS